MYEYANAMTDASTIFALSNFSMESKKTIKSALVSVYYKDNLEPIIRKLHSLNVALYSTGGTLTFIEQLGIPVTAVDSVTGYPEIFGGRVKTLHPAIFGGILNRRDNASDQKEKAQHNIPDLDLVIVDLYPFEETVASGAAAQDIIEKIDIGGISLIRAAAKNFNDVVIVSSRHEYPVLQTLLENGNGATTLEERRTLAAKAFATSSHYDTAIFHYFNTDEPIFKLSSADGKVLRYGENPHQRGYFFGDFEAMFTQLHGKELSYNNLLDSDGAWELVRELHQMHLREHRAKGAINNPDVPHTCAIIKHTNPCGVGVANSPLAAFTNAKATDPVSAFGGIIAFSGLVDEAAAKEIAEMFAEVIIAPDFSEDARKVLAAKKNLRVLRMGEHQAITTHLELRRISGGVLVQERDAELLDEEKFEIVTDRKPTPAEMRALRFGWAICKHVKSNAIVYAKDNQLVGVGAGQMSRVDSVKLGASKAQLPLAGSVLASDAFFPFRDGLDEAAKHGITAVIQPGGSMRDKEVIEAANQHNLAMIFTSMRHFKH